MRRIRYPIRGTVCLVLLVAAAAAAAAQRKLPSSNQPQARQHSTFQLPQQRAKFAADSILVRYRTSAAARAAAATHASRRVSVRRKFQSVPRLEVLQLPAGLDVRAALHTYRSDPDVLYAEPNYFVYPSDTKPNDPLFPLTWGLYNIGQDNGTPGADIGAVKAWDLITGGANVVVGVIDTGVQTSHPDLAGSVLAAINVTVDGDNNDYVGHGTHVSGTIGAHGNDGTGVAGVNWQVQLLPCKFLTVQQAGTTENAIACLDWIASQKQSGLNVVATNNSWGGGAASRALHDAIQAQMQLGILFIAAAGNGGFDDVGDDNDTVANYPSNYDLANVIAVAATDRDDRLADFSNFGRHSVHLGAPGVGVVSSVPWSTWQSFDGTSMATPHVTGSAALLKAYNPNWTWWQIRNLLLAGGDPIPALSQTITGNRLNVYGAMTCSNRIVESRLQPRSSAVTTSMNGPVKLSMLHINCADPAGGETVNVSDGTTVQLEDDGAGADDVAGDGIYSALWYPPAFGVYTLTFPNADTITVTVLKPYSYQRATSSYIEISGTNLNLGDDDAAAVASPFPIHFGSQTFNSVYVSANGFITLDGPYTYFESSMPFPLPYYGAGTLVAPFWDDLDPSAGGGVYWDVVGAAPNRQLVIEWRNVPHYGYPYATQTVRFEVVFNESVDDVAFNYSSVDFGGPLSSILDAGAAASVGLQVGTPEATQFSWAKPSLSAGLSLLWQLANPDFGLSVSPSTQTVFPGQSATFSTTITALYDFSSSVSISCTGAAPPTCSSTSVTPARAGTLTPITASATAPAAYNFAIQGQSSDTPAIVHSVDVALNVVDFAIAGPSGPISIADGGSATFAVPVTAAGPFGGTVTLSCSSLPAGAICGFAPSNSIQPTAASPATVSVTVTLAANTPVGTQNITIVANSPGAPASKTQAVTLAISSNPDFLVSTSTPIIGGLAATGVVALAPQDGYGGTVNLTCTVAPAGPVCSVAPASVSAIPASATVSVSANGATSGSYTVTVTGSDGTRTHAVSMTYSVPDFAITAAPAAVAYAYTFNSVPFTITALNGYTGTMDLSCDASSMQTQFQSCLTNPGTITMPYYTNPARGQASFYINPQPLNGSFPLVITARDRVTRLTRQFVVQVTPRTFTFTHGPGSDRTVIANESADPITFTFTPYNGFDLPVTIGYWNGCPGCSFSPTQLVPDGSPQQVTLAITPPAPTQLNYSNGTFQVLPYVSSDQNSADRVQLIGASDGPTNINVQDYVLNSPVLGWPSLPLTVVPGHSASTSFTYQSINGFSAPVTVACSALIAPGVSCSFDRTTLNPGDTAILTVTADANALVSRRTLTVTADAIINGHDIAKQASINIDIYNLAIAVEPASTTVPSGGETYYLVSATIAPNTAVQDFDCTVTDPGITCEHPLRFDYYGFSYIDVRTTDGVTPVGSHTITVTANDGNGGTASATATIVMQGHNSLILTSPNGFDLWSSGQQTITWKYTGNPGTTVRLELWDRGSFSQLIADNVALGANGSGSYQWTVPDTLPFSQYYKVKISSDQDPSINDMSDNRVWMGKGVDLVTPKAGFVYYLGPNNSIYVDLIIYYTWSVYRNIKFDLYKGGQFVTTLNDGSLGSGYFYGCWGEPDVLQGGCWEWAANGTAYGLQPGTDYSIKATPLADPTRAVMGPQFTLAVATMNVTSPSAGEIWAPGSAHTINWSWSATPVWLGSSDVQLTLVAPYYSSIITPSAPLGAGGTGSFTWTVPANVPPRNDYQISVSTFGQTYLFGATSGKIAIGSFNHVTVQLNGNGLVSDATNVIYCPSNCTAIYATGSTVTLNALSAGFTGWSGPCSGTGACTFTVTQDVTVTANFTTPAGLSITGPIGPLPAINAGGSAQFDVTLSSVGGTVGPVSLSCAGLPSGASCSFSQNGFFVSQPTVVGVTIKTTGPNSAALVGTRNEGLAFIMAFAFMYASIVFMRSPRQHRRALLTLSLAMIGFSVSCGGGGGSGTGGGGGTPSLATPPGTYSISINADSASNHVSTQITLTVH